MHTTTLMIAMLYHSEIDIEISNTGIETVETDNCREVLGDNRDANGMLATI